MQKKYVKKVILIFETFHEIMELQMKVAVATSFIVIAFSITALVSAYAFHDHHHRKVFVGSVGLLVSSAMYGSPLVAVVSQHYYYYYYQYLFYLRTRY